MLFHAWNFCLLLSHAKHFLFMCFCLFFLKGRSSVKPAVRFTPTDSQSLWYQIWIQMKQRERPRIISITTVGGSAPSDSSHLVVLLIQRCKWSPSSFTNTKIFMKMCQKHVIARPSYQKGGSAFSTNTFHTRLHNCPSVWPECGYQLIETLRSLKPRRCPKFRACLLMWAPSVSRSPFKAVKLHSCLSVFLFGSRSGAGTVKSRRPLIVCVG